jgi:hypothetical protein
MTRFISSEEAAMNDKTGGNRGPRRAAALAVVAAVAVLATACGSSTPSPVGPGPGGSYSYPQELALAQCMRGHGLPNFPDPDPSGGFSSNVLSMVDSSQGQAAYGACRHLLTGAPSISQLQQDLQQQQQEEAKALPLMVKFDQCMRTHGVPDFSLTGQSTPASAKGAGFSPNSPQFQSAVRTCQHVLPAGAHVSISAHSSAETNAG